MSCSSYQSCKKQLVTHHTGDEDAILVGKDMCCDNPISTSYETFAELPEMAMEENNLQMPGTPMEASVLYNELLFHIESLK